MSITSCAAQYVHAGNAAQLAVFVHTCMYVLGPYFDELFIYLLWHQRHALHLALRMIPSTMMASSTTECTCYAGCQHSLRRNPEGAVKKEYDA